MPGSSTTPGRSDLAMVRPKRVAFRARNSVGARGLAFAAPWLAYALPYRRFVGVLTNANARLGADVDRYTFIVVDLHHLLLAGLPAHFESYMPSQAVQSLSDISGLRNCARVLRRSTSFLLKLPARWRSTPWSESGTYKVPRPDASESATSCTSARSRCPIWRLPIVQNSPEFLLVTPNLRLRFLVRSPVLVFPASSWLAVLFWPWCAAVVSSSPERLDRTPINHR